MVHTWPGSALQGGDPSVGSTLEVPGDDAQLRPYGTDQLSLTSELYSKFIAKTLQR